MVQSTREGVIAPGVWGTRAQGPARVARRTLDIPDADNLCRITGAPAHAKTFRFRRYTQSKCLRSRLAMRSKRRGGM